MKELNSSKLIIVSIGWLILMRAIPLSADVIDQGEDWDRQVDRAALESQNLAIQKLRKLSKKYENSKEESSLLMRLAQVYDESASIEFRITYAKSHQKKTIVNLDRYNSILNYEISTLTHLIHSYPNFDSVDLAFYMRGKAYDELGKKDEAKSDYLNVVKKSNSSRIMPAYMALADMAIEKNQHVEAIAYLNEIEKYPKTPFFPFALYKLAWSYFNLKDIQKALAHIERHINYFDNLKETRKSLSASDTAIRENSLMDAVVFFVEGNEQNPDYFKLPSALNYFRSLEKGPLLGRMSVRFGKLLRSHRRDDELMKWKNQLLEEEKRRPETIEVVMSLFEHQMNQDQFEKAMQTSADIVELHRVNDQVVRESDSYRLARKLLSETAIEVQARLAKSGNATQVSLLLKTLGTIYGVFIHIMPESDPLVAQAHYNLAETLFKSGDYQSSTQHYLWVISNWHKDSNLNSTDLKLKAIASRYEDLRSSNLIPKVLVPQLYDQGKDQDLIKKLSKSSYEWVTWIDSLSHELTVSGDKLDSFLFEANRVIYTHASTRLASQRLVEFALSRSSSQYAVPSATLAIDTYIKSEMWDEAFKLTMRLLGKKWVDATFSERLSGIAANSAYKIAELFYQKKDYLKAIDQAKVLQQKFQASDRASDSLLLTAQSYLALQQKDRAGNFFSELIQKYPGSHGHEIALLNRAQISEESYEFKQAIEDYKRYLALTQKSSSVKNFDEIQRRIYFLQWIDGRSDFDCSNTLIKNVVDRDELSTECQRYNALNILRQDPKSYPIDSTDLDQYLTLALKGNKKNRVIWSAVVLKFDTSIQLRDQLYLLRNVSKGWEDLDPLSRISVVPIFSVLLPKSFERARISLKQEVPLNKASVQAITRRAEWIKEYENVASNALVLPWSRIRARVLQELSGVYLDFSTTLENISIPKDMNTKEVSEYTNSVKEIVKPFMERSKDIGKKAYHLASNSAIEDDDFRIIKESNSDLFDIEVREIKNKIPQWSEKSSIDSLELNALKIITSSSDYSALQIKEVREEFSKSSKQLPWLLKKLWLESFQNHAWEKNAYLLQEMKAKNIISKAEIKVMQGLILIASGAKAEGLVELQEAVQELDTPNKLELDKALFSHYAHTGSVEVSLRLANEINNINTKLLKDKSEGKL